MVPFCPFYFRVPFLKPNTKKKGTLIYGDGATQEPSLRLGSYNRDFG